MVLANEGGGGYYLAMFSLGLNVASVSDFRTYFMVRESVFTSTTWGVFVTVLCCFVSNFRTYFVVLLP